MLNILVTGGTGFIGSHTCLELIQRNYKIKIIDSLANSSLISLDRIKRICELKKLNVENNISFVKADLRNFEILNNLFREEKEKNQPIQGVIHFAGLKSVGESIIKPLKYWDNNLISTINLLKAMNINDCRNIVFSSSATIYGKVNKKLINEDDSFNPMNPYGQTKLSIERLLHDIYKSNSQEWNIANLRYFNPIGAHKSGLIGENPIGTPNNIFPIILKVASGIIPELKIFGNDWPTNDGTGIRDYIHVMDLAEGHLSALEFLFSQNGKILDLNLGTSKGTSVLELVDCFQKVNNIKIPYSFVERRSGDVARVVANNKLSKNLLNWFPKRDLYNMCEDGWNWKKLNPNGY